MYNLLFFLYILLLKYKFFANNEIYRNNHIYKESSNQRKYTFDLINIIIKRFLYDECNI